MALTATRVDLVPVARQIAMGMSVTADWQGAIASWPPAVSLIAGRASDQALGRFVFETLLSPDGLCATGRAWMAFLDGGPLPLGPARVPVTVRHPRDSFTAAATFVPILRSEVFETALFLEQINGPGPRLPLAGVEHAIEHDYPRLRAALRRALTSSAAVAAEDVVGTLIVLDV